MSDTRKFLDNVLAGKSAESRTQFDGVMSQKMNAALDLRKVSLTSELFGKKVAEETISEAKEVTVSVDFAGSERDLKRAAKKYGIKVVTTTDTGDVDGIADLKGTKANILKLLTDPKEYGYDEEEAKELYTDLK